MPFFHYLDVKVFALASLPTTVDYRGKIVNSSRIWRRNVKQARTPNITGIVLAGGKSLRLGREKALERINQQSLIERTIDCLFSVSQAIIVVTSQEQFDTIASARLKGKVVVDLYPDKAALGGIYTGLSNADTLHSLVVGCDMPFLNRALLSHLIYLAPDYDAVIPKIGNMGEPLHAIYSKNCLPSIEQLLHQNKLAISQLFGLVKTKYIDGDEIAKFDPNYLSFFNINTEDDLIKAKALIQESEQPLIVREDWS